MPPFRISQNNHVRGRFVVRGRGRGRGFRGLATLAIPGPPNGEPNQHLHEAVRGRDRRAAIFRRIPDANEAPEQNHEQPPVPMALRQFWPNSTHGSSFASGIELPYIPPEMPDRTNSDSLDSSISYDSESIVNTSDEEI